MSNEYTRTTITLPQDVLKTLRKVVPKGKYSEYAAVALKEKLDREKSWKFTEAFGKLKSKKGAPLFFPRKFLSKIDSLEEKEMGNLRKRK